MIREDGPQDLDSGEIPFAKRTLQSNRISRKRIRVLLLSSIFLGIFSTSIFNIFFLKQVPISKLRQSSKSEEENSLLGHYPYPEAKPENLVSVYPGFKVHMDTYKALIEMRSAASADGIQLVLLSGYRSINLQKQIFYSNKSIRNQIAIERAKDSAPPGYSEHSTGYAIDLGDSTMRHTDFEVEFEQTPAFKWLKRNAAKYHFILSFPKGNSQKVSYEPWHWRYEGSVKALQQFEKANQSMRLDIEQKNYQTMDK